MIPPFPNLTISIITFMCLCSILTIVATSILLNKMPFWQVATIFDVILGVFSIALFSYVGFVIWLYVKTKSGNNNAGEATITTNPDTEKDGNSSTFARLADDGTTTPPTNNKCSAIASNKICTMIIPIVLAILNFILLVVVMSFLYPETFHPTQHLIFHRIASVNDTSATFWIRNPTKTNVQLRVRPHDDNNVASTNWQMTFVSPSITSTTDYTAWIIVNNLNSSTKYDWSFDDDDDNNTQFYQFTTTPPPGTKSPLTFYFGSCFVTNYPSFQSSPAWSYLLKYNLDFILWIGDFIYADHPQTTGIEVDNYRILYRKVLSNPFMTKPLQTIPSYYQFDDHEVQDNWDKGNTSPMFVHAMQAYREYLGGGNPSPYAADKRYYSFHYGACSFFVLDTRSYRNLDNDPDSTTHTMIGNEQKSVLMSWLEEQANNNNHTIFKFLVSTVPWHTVGLNTDSWGGFQRERAEIFNKIRSLNMSGMVFLSGDQHFTWSKGSLDYQKSGFYEFSSSPLSAFDGGIPPWNKMSLSEIATMNEPVSFSQGTTSGYASYMMIMKVYVDAADPYIVASTYERGDNLLHVDTLLLSETVPK
jgi:phosphodiesterase/alkaline phosphatase D-like protein